MGWTVTGREIELTEMQERIVRAILAWSVDGRTITVPNVGRQSGKTTIMATVAEYHRRGHLVAPSDALRDRLAYSGDVIRRKLLTDAAFHAEVHMVGQVLDLIGATSEQVDAAHTALSMRESWPVAADADPPLIPCMVSREQATSDVTRDDFPSKQVIDDVNRAAP